MPRNQLWCGMLVAAVSVVLAGKTIFAQGTPFTILRPADGAIVREQVRIEVPRASIPQGGFIAIYIDGRFHASLAPKSGDREPRLRYIWDTKSPILDPSTGKSEPIKDGDHTITVVLHDADSRAIDRSEVRVQVANQEGIRLPGVGTRLQYRFRLGENVNYRQRDQVILLAGQTGVELTGGVTGEQVAYDATTTFNLFAYDLRGSDFIIRQRANRQQVMAYNQPVYTLGEDMFRAVLQFVTPAGNVVYQNVDTTTDPYVFRLLVLPILPEMRVRIGDTWQTRAPILLPDMPVERAPRVTVQNRLEGVEWEGGYPTVKIRQTYDGVVPGRLEFSNFVLQDAKVKLDRTLWFAFNAGRLVRSEATIEIEGQVPTGFQAPRMAGLPGAGIPGAPPTAGGPAAMGTMGAPRAGASPYGAYGAPYGVGAPYGPGVPSGGAGVAAGRRMGAAGIPGAPPSGIPGVPPTARTGRRGGATMGGIPGVPGEPPMMGPTSGAAGPMARGGMMGAPRVPGAGLQAREQAPLKLRVVQSVQLAR